MKKVLFLKLELLNFCGIREASYDFSDAITLMSGRNGIGKTSVINAITYVLFGMDHQGNSLDIKTFDKDHTIIKEIPHEVALTLSVDGDIVTFKKTLNDKWNGDGCKNTYKFFVDGEVTTAGDYKTAIDNILPMRIFNYCLSANLFVNEPWNVQRSLLEDIAGGDVTADDITGGDGRYDFVVKALMKEDIKSLMHHLKYNKNEVQKQLDLIPTRLAELNKAMPEKQDWTTLAGEQKLKQNRLDEIRQQIASINSGGAEQAHKANIRQQIEFQRKRIDQMELSARNQADDEATKHSSDVLNAQKEVSKATFVVDDLKAQMREYTETEVHAKQQKEECEKKVKDYNDELKALSQEQWEWDDNQSFCPYCLQPLPLDKVSEMKAQSLQNFNERKAEKKKQIMQDFGSLQNQYTLIKELLATNDRNRTETINELTIANKTLKDAENKLAEVRNITPRTYGDYLRENESYRQATEQIKALEEQLNQPSTDTAQQDLLVQYNEESSSLAAEISSIGENLAAKKVYEDIQSLIEKAQKDKVTYQQQIDELDAKLAIAADYSQKSCRILEDRVNEHFGFVQWSLFKTKLNGEQEPFCECYHDGVPYSRLNGAAKVNAGIDIAYTIANHYGVSIPIVLDECESNLAPIYRGGQQIRLSVSPDEKLKITYIGGNQD